MQDYELIKRIRQGERALFGQLADKYYDDIFRYCYYQTGNEQAAWDCTQDTFCHLIRFLDNYTERGKFKSYLLRIALNACRDYYRKSKPELLYEELSEEKVVDSYASAFEGQTERKLLISEALALLPDTQREAIILHFYYGYKIREIARITGTPLSTAKTRLRAGMQKLEKLIDSANAY